MPSTATEVEVPILVPEAIRLEKEKEPWTAVVDTEKEMEPSHVHISEAMLMESVAKPLALVSKTTVTDKEIEPSTPVSEGRALSEEIESPALVSKSIPFEANVPFLASESIPSEVEVPIQEDLEASVTEPVPLVL